MRALALLALGLAACAPHLAAVAPPVKACAPALPAVPRTAGLIAVASAGDGSVTLVQSSSLALARVIDAPVPGRVEGSMHVIEDARRGVFWVANFGGGLGRIPAVAESGPVTVAQTGGPLAGLALSPDGCTLAVNGARDLTLRLVDPSGPSVLSRVVLGNAADAPKHPPLLHGDASTHPLWLADSSAVLTEDNLHEEIVLVSRDGRVLARRATRSPVHSLLLTKSGEALALEEGAQGVLPRVLVLNVPSLEVARAMEVALPAGEPARLHHGALSPDGETVVVANMGPLKGESADATVTAFRWRTGEKLWSTPTIRNAGHVAFSGGKVVVLGHRAAEILLLDGATGAHLEDWPVLGAGSLGHSLGIGPDGSVTILDAPLGRLLRFRAGDAAGESERVGAGDAESSLPE